MKSVHFIKISLMLLASMGYLSIVVIAPIHMAHMAEMDIPIEYCPFAVEEHSLCKMNQFEHLKVWQDFTTTFLPLTKILPIMGTLFTSILFSYHSPELTRFLFYLRRERRRMFSLFQYIFSQGILNPKAP